MKKQWTITQSLLMQAAKFIQNHKIKAYYIEFNANQECINFLDENIKIIAWVSYTNVRHGKDFWISK